MVKDQDSEISNIFHALSDPTRRQILERLSRGRLTVTEIKIPFRMSLVAISKHLKVLERAHLIQRQKMGREFLIGIHPQPLRDAYKYIETYKKDWSRHLDAMEKFVERNG